MCANAKIGQYTVSPGASMLVYGRSVNDYKKWGIGDIYNARVENLDSYWKGLERVITEISGFYEGGKLFTGPFKIGCIYNPRYNGFAIITRPALEPVKFYHHRSPLCLEDPDSFLNGTIREIDYSKIRIAA